MIRRHSQNLRPPQPVDRCEVSTLAMKLKQAYDRAKAERETAEAGQ